MKVFLNLLGIGGGLVSILSAMIVGLITLF